MAAADEELGPPTRGYGRLDALEMGVSRKSAISPASSASAASAAGRRMPVSGLPSFGRAWMGFSQEMRVQAQPWSVPRPPRDQGAEPQAGCLDLGQHDAMPSEPRRCWRRSVCGPGARSRVPQVAGGGAGSSSATVAMTSLQTREPYLPPLSPP